MQNGSLRGPREDPLPNAIQEETGKATALHEAASTGDEKSLRVLLAAGADRNAKDPKHGNTPLHEAAWRGYSRCVKTLCSLPQPKAGKDLKEVKLKGVLQETRGALHSALLGTRNAGGFSALHLAAQNGHNQSCREILLAGGDPDVQNNYGDTPLHTACRYGHAGATRILLSAKCDPNRTNLNGDTALHISCAMGRRKLTRILLEAGSSPEIKNAQNEMPRDIALRKNLPEILEILDSPIVVKVPRERERSSSNSKSAGKDKVDGQKTKSDKKPDYVADPANWSPYGCHYFPDPRSFPSPKLETLPKEPLAKGEQYYLDLAGNIRKGPIGVGNTCYCGPFFRHIEERISRNKKSLRKYVHKATERLDNKVQALALKTDDQIEQLTRSMIADRIRCEGRRIHLEQWLKRGEPTRATVGHHLKSKKNLDNTNTLTRCKSLELLDDASLDDKKIQNSRSFDILDEADVIVHHDADQSDQRRTSSQISSERKTSKTSKTSDRGSRLDRDSYSVSECLEELLAKTNEILEMEKITRNKKKQQASSTFTYIPENIKKKTKTPEKLKVSSHSRHSMYTEDIIQHLKRTSLTDEERFSKDVNDTEFIEQEMKKITKSLLQTEFDDSEPPLSPEILKDFPSQKEIERRSDQEQEKSSILSGSSQKNPSSSGSGYVPEFSHLRLSRNHSEAVSGEIMNKSISMSPDVPHSPIDGMSYHRDYHNVVEALRNGYHQAARHVVEAEISQNLLQSQEIGLPLNVGYQDHTNPEDNTTANVNTLNGFYQNSSFDDAASSSNNTLKSERRHNISVSEKSSQDTEDTVELSEMANVSQINELKSRILNGSNWKSQALKKTQQQINKKSEDKDVKSINGIVQKIEIKNSEIKTGILRRSKVQELVAKIQGESSSPDHKDDEENSDSSEDELDHPNQRIYTNKIENPQLQHIPGEDQYFYNRAQPQVAPPYYCQPNFNNNNVNLQKSVHELPVHTTPVIEARNLIPKDAYFHELPNKDRLRPIVDSPGKRILNFSEHLQPTPPISLSPSSGYNPNQNPLVAARTRNPLPYLQGYDVPPLLSNNNYVQIHPPNNRNQIPGANLPRHIPYPEKLLPNKKFIENRTDNLEVGVLLNYEFPYNHINKQQSPIMHSPSHTITQTISITPEQAQIERDQNNDSGYSTKICGSSHGPSPSLFGSNGTGEYTVGNEEMNHKQGHLESNGDATYFVGNIGTSSLV